MQLTAIVNTTYKAIYGSNSKSSDWHMRLRLILPAGQTASGWEPALSVIQAGSKRGRGTAHLRMSRSPMTSIDWLIDWLQNKRWFIGYFIPWISMKNNQYADKHVTHISAVLALHNSSIVQIYRYIICKLPVVGLRVTCSPRDPRFAGSKRLRSMKGLKT